MIRLVGDSVQFKQMINESTSIVDRFANSMKQYGAQIAAGLGVIGLLGTAQHAIHLAAELESVSISFETMLGSATKAKEMLVEIQKYASATPFEQAPLRGSAQMLMNYGIAANQIMPTLRMLGDVSAGDQNKLNGLSYAFAQMSARGRVAGDDLRQMINWGFNPLQEMARTSGKNMSELTERMHDGKINIDMLKGAFQSATAEGGRFFGMMDKQSRTFTGLWSTVKDEMAVLLTEIGQQLIKHLDIKKIMADTIVWLQEATKYMKVYGEYIVIVVIEGTKFLIGMVALKLAIYAAGVAMSVYTAATKGAAISQAILLALQGPKGWVQLAAGLALAATATYQISQGFAKVADDAKKAANGIKEVANEVKGMDNRKAGEVIDAIDVKLKELNRFAREMNFRGMGFNREKKADAILADEGVNRALGIKTMTPELSEVDKQVNELRKTLRKLEGDWGAALSVKRARQLKDDVNRELAAIGNEKSGANEMFTSTRDQLRKLQEELDPSLTKARMMASGMSKAKWEEIQENKKLISSLENELRLKKAIADIRGKHSDQRIEADALADSMDSARVKMGQEMDKWQSMFSQGLLSKNTLDKLNKHAQEDLLGPVQGMLDSIRTPREKLQREIAEIDKQFEAGRLTQEQRDKLVNKATRHAEGSPVGLLDSAMVGTREAAAHVSDYLAGADKSATLNPGLVAANKTNETLDKILEALGPIKSISETMAGEPPPIEIKAGSLIS